MKPLFYYFGIRRGRRIFSIKEPIFFRGSWIERLYDFNLKELIKKCGGDANGLIEEFVNAGNELVGFAKSAESVGIALKCGKLISPSISGKMWNIFFLNEEKLVIFKEAKGGANIITKANVWDIVNKLRLLSKRKFLKEMVEWKKAMKADSCCDEGWVIMSREIEVSIGNFEECIVALKPKKYSALKKLVKKKFRQFVPSPYYKTPKTIKNK